MYQLVKRLKNNKNIAGLSPKVMFANNPKLFGLEALKLKQS